MSEEILSIQGKKKDSPVETFDGRVGVGPEVNRNDLPTNDLLQYVFLDKSPGLTELNK